MQQIGKDNEFSWILVKISLAIAGLAVLAFEIWQVYSKGFLVMIVSGLGFLGGLLMVWGAFTDVGVWLFVIAAAVGYYLPDRAD